MPEMGNDIRGVIELLWSRKWQVLAAALIGGLVAALIAWRQTPIYASEAKVLVKSVVLSPTDSTQTIEVNMDTEAELAISAPVAELVQKDLDLSDAPDDLAADLNVEVAPSTEILSFTYEASDPEVAQQRAQAFADAYLAYRLRQVTDETLQLVDAPCRPRAGRSTRDCRRSPQRSPPLMHPSSSNRCGCKPTASRI